MRKLPDIVRTQDPLPRRPMPRFDFSGLELDRLDEETGLWERI